MEAVVASVGGILVVLSFSGVSLESRFVATQGPLPPGDRIAGALVGWALIAVSMLVEVGNLSEHALWVALGIGTLCVWRLCAFPVVNAPTWRNARTPAGHMRGPVS
jgi:hypothetical protein